MELRILVGAIRRSAALIILAVVAGFLVGSSASSPSDLRRAEASIVLDPEGGRGPDAPAFSGDPDRYVEAELGIMRSQALAAAAARTLPGVGVDVVSESVSFQQRPGSSLVDVVATAPTAGEAVAIADAVASTYMATHAEQRSAGAQDRLTRAEARLEALLAELTAVQARMEAAITAEEDRTGVPDPADVVARDALLRQYDQQLSVRTGASAAMESNADRTAVIQPAVAVDAGDDGVLRPATIGALAGLVLGIGGALIRNASAPRVLDRHQAEQLTGLAASATVAVGTLTSPHALSSRSRRAVRRAAALLASGPAVEPPAVIAVCEPSPTHSAPAVAIGLAEAYADDGFRVVFAGVPGVEDVPWTPAGPAVALTSDRGTTDRWLLEPTDRRGIAVAQRAATDPAPLDAARVRELRKLLEERADVVVLGLPALLDSAIGPSAIHGADTVALVVTLRRQSENDVALAQQLLSTTSADIHLLVATSRASLPS